MGYPQFVSPQARSPQQPRPAGGTVAMRLVPALLSIPAAAFLFILGIISVMATDSCSQDSTEFLCSELGVVLLMSPAVTGPVLGVVAVVLACCAGIRHHRVWWAVFASAWGVCLASLMLSFAIGIGIGS